MQHSTHQGAKKGSLLEICKTQEKYQDLLILMSIIKKQILKASVKLL